MNPIENISFQKNMFVAVGSFDELSSYRKNQTDLCTSFWTTNIETKTVYGSISNNTACQLVIARTNHLLSPISPVNVRATII